MLLAHFVFSMAILAISAIGWIYSMQLCLLLFLIFPLHFVIKTAKILPRLSLYLLLFTCFSFKDDSQCWGPSLFWRGLVGWIDFQPPHLPSPILVFLGLVLILLASYGELLSHGAINQHLLPSSHGNKRKHAHAHTCKCTSLHTCLHTHTHTCTRDFFQFLSTKSIHKALVNLGLN